MKDADKSRLKWKRRRPRDAGSTLAAAGGVMQKETIGGRSSPWRVPLEFCREKRHELVNQVPAIVQLVN